MTRPASSRLLAGLLLVALAGCAPAEPANVPASAQSPFTGYRSDRYDAPAAWLCRPDLPEDPCRVVRPETVVRADGSREVVTPARAKDPDVDCFYVYPTVDHGFFAKNHDDFEDLGPMTATTIAQVAHFGEACALYVPLYRQATLGTYYLTTEARRERFLSVAFSDVEDAFLHYMGRYNHGRKIVLIGHSQGAEMVLRLLAKRFDADPAMRERLVVALAVGAKLETARGERTGGTLANIPLCASPDETGCVIGYRSFGAGATASPGAAAPGEGRESACVLPAGADGRFSRAIFAVNDDLRDRFPTVREVATPFVVYPDYYAGRCAEGEGGFRYLEVREAPRPGDVRKSLFPLDAWYFRSSLGLHVLDMQFAQGDLVDLVRRKSAPGR